MAASGVPIPNNNHANNIIKAALELKAFMLTYEAQRKKQQKPFFQVRIGIHSGPLVAGVVGTQKFQYDIWGGTVNIASRMESQSEAGKVNISASTYHLVKDEPYTFIARGKVSMKGLEEMDMYFVDGVSGGLV